ncbi:rRNA processing protein, partial [Ascosphaera atra]
TDSQRRDALAHLTTFIKARPVDTPLPQPMSMFLPSLLPLILDASKGVRTQLLKLFQVLPKEELVGTAAQILPYVRAGLTHLAADIRVSSIDILSWLLSVLGEEVVSCSGGWIKTLNCFLSVLGWHTEESTKWSASRTSFGKAGTDGKPVAKALAALAEFLRVGIVPEEPEENEEEQRPLGWRYWPLRDYEFHMMPTRPNPYGYLNLFGPPRDEEDAPYETIDDRLRVFNENFRTPIERGLDAARREGGEAGRASALVLKVLKDAGVEEGEEA